MGFAESLQTLRKEAKITQEQLASHLGVSAQAVSKWENGSYPDGDLLPRIADYFGVSIDYLYGREGRRPELEQQIVNECAKIWAEVQSYNEGEKAFTEKLHRSLWAFQIASWKNVSEYWERPRLDKDAPRQASCIAFDTCYSFMGLDQGRDFYLFLRQPEGAKGYESWFTDTAEVRELFGFLSDSDNMRIIEYMYSLKSFEFAGPDSVAKATGIDKAKIEKALTYLGKIGFGTDSPVREVSIVDGNGKNSEAYGVNITLGGLIMGLMAVADAYVHSPSGYSMQVTNRQYSWLDGAKLKDCK